MKTRRDLLKSKGYWLAKIQVELYQEIEAYKKKHHINNTQLAELLGCSKGYVSQVLNGDFDHKLSKFIELSLAVGKIPHVVFEDLDEYIYTDSKFFSLQMTNQTFFRCENSCNIDYEIAA